MGLNAFFASLACIFKLPEREVYLEDSLRRLIAMGHTQGWQRQFLTPDTSVKRGDEGELHKINRPFNVEEDYPKLRPPAGTTIDGCVGSYFCPVVTFDYKSQYPSIMRAYNYCLTSMVRDKNSTQGEVKMLTNVRPVHTMETLPNGKRKFQETWEVVNYPVRFLAAEEFKSALNMSSEILSAAREHYKSLLKDPSLT